jgi:hypothetical protein
VHKALRFAVLVFVVLALLAVSLPAAFASEGESCGVDDTTPSAGQTVNVFGSGWAPDRGASIKFAQGGMQERLGRAQTDSNGDFSKDVMIPEWASLGSAQIVVKGNVDDVSGKKHACKIPVTIVPDD